MVSKPKPDHGKAQVEKFRDLARELECDDDEEAFRAKFKKVATAPKAVKPKPD